MIRTHASRFVLAAAVACDLASQSASAAAPAMGCKAFGFSGAVSSHHEFRRVIGPEAIFVMVPSKGVSGGWQMEVRPPDRLQPPDDELEYIYPLNRPYRNRNDSYLDLSYGGFQAQDAVYKGLKREFWFNYTVKDGKKASWSVRQLIFSAPVQSQETSVAQLGALPMGRATLSITSADVIPGIGPSPDSGKSAANLSEEQRNGVIKRIAFQMRLVVPDGYVVPPEFAVRPAACPRPWLDQWEH
ncbi:hypothetical protein LRH25_11375 [Ideonella azotifigens]|uniref:Uncharacterized protein n=1 Tax=Ideonella azotifigens TaxID=513160 RepID=A0ABN1JST2_9BURK|nr:hypothetical protein [Ideonella azotifigens]MCD2340942.1 hypothetical protein [Ideonella azotifigens]